MSREELRARSPLRGKYLVQNRGWNAALRLTDVVLSATAGVRTVAAIGQPRRILVAIGGHLGDAVIATSVLPGLARAFPDADIGMLLPSWSRSIVEGHPRLRWIHHVDHWKMNRGGASARAKWNQYRSTMSRALEELRGVEYDVAIDLYAYYPNAAVLLWRAGIPMRIGYTSGGCGPLYTNAVDWTAGLGHTAVQHQRLVRLLSETAGEGEPRYDLPHVPLDVAQRAATLASSRYLVVHAGTGDQKKAWPTDRWRELIARLLAAGEFVVLTGRGEGERRIADGLADAHARVSNLVGQLDWASFRAVLGGARLVIGPDSVAVHASAAAGVPTIAIMAAMSDPEYWKPLGPGVAVLTRSVPCAPCFRKAGCPAMTCVRDVSVDEAFAAYRRLAGEQPGPQSPRSDAE